MTCLPARSEEDAPMPASGETVENTGGTASGQREGPPAPATAPSWKFQLLCMRLDNVRHGYVLQYHSICMVTFPYFDLRISQGTCFGLFLDCFRLGPTYR